MKLPKHASQNSTGCSCPAHLFARSGRTRRCMKQTSVVIKLIHAYCPAFQEDCDAGDATNRLNKDTFAAARVARTSTSRCSRSLMGARTISNHTPVMRGRRQHAVAQRAHAGVPPVSDSTFTPQGMRSNTVGGLYHGAIRMHVCVGERRGRGPVEDVCV